MTRFRARSSAWAPIILRSVRKRVGTVVRVALPAVAVSAAVATVVVFATRSGGEAPASSNVAAAAAPGTAARFAVLRKASSNQCGLRSAALSTMARGGPLQGACCSGMDLHRYREQVAGLRRYADVPEVPRDPYDVSVVLAKRLIAYDASIEFSRAQQATYDRAMKLSEEGGPCCCQCWRWTAFGGQAKFLITRRNYGSKQVAELWGLEDGCGGAGHEHNQS